MTWNAPAAIGYGTALGASQLNATPNIEGNLTYSPPVGTVLAAGNHTLSATFTPTDSENYTAASMDVAIVVAKASAFILTIPTAAGLNFGQTLADASLSGGAANVLGSFAFASHGTQPSAGNSTHTVLFTPTDSGNYTVASVSVSLQVNSLPAIDTPPPVSSPASAPSGGGSPPEKAKKGKGAKKSSASKSASAKSKSSSSSSAKKSSASKSSGAKKSGAKNGKKK